MPVLQELKVQGPSLTCETFFVELPAGPDWQRWEKRLEDGEELEFYLDHEGGEWLPATIRHWEIDDGSGNAPGANAHFFYVLKRGEKLYTCDLDVGDRIRLEAPTNEELAVERKYCEDLELVREGTQWVNEEWGPCQVEGTVRIGQSWYCSSHARMQIIEAN